MTTSRQSGTDSLGTDTDVDNFELLEAVKQSMTGQFGLNFKVPWSSTKGRVRSRRTHSAGSSLKSRKDTKSEEDRTASLKLRVGKAKRGFRGNVSSGFSEFESKIVECARALREGGVDQILLYPLAFSLWKDVLVCALHDLADENYFESTDMERIVLRTGILCLTLLEEAQRCQNGSALAMEYKKLIFYRRHFRQVVISSSKSEWKLLRSFKRTKEARELVLSNVAALSNLSKKNSIVSQNARVSKEGMRRGMASRAADSSEVLSPPFEALLKDFLGQNLTSLFTSSRKFSLLVSVLVEECSDMHLKHFEEIRPLGKGSFGVVSLVRSKRTGALYALKRIEKMHIVNRHKGISTLQLLDERAAMIRSGHSDFVTRLHYAWSDPSVLFMVMDVCLGGDLKLHLRCKFDRGPPKGAPPKRHPILGVMLAPFAEDAARFYAAEILLGLEDLHSSGIIHRDLKPSNCLMDEQGHIRLADLGLAYVWEGSAPRAKLFRRDAGLKDPQMTPVTSTMERRRSFHAILNKVDMAMGKASRGSATPSPAPPSDDDSVYSPSPAEYIAKQTKRKQRSHSPAFGRRSSFGSLSPSSYSPNPGKSTPTGLYKDPCADHIARNYSGTLEYASPEQLQRGTLYGRSADFWAFGVMVYTMMAGPNPFLVALVQNQFRELEKKEQKALQRHLCKELTLEYPQHLFSPEAKDLIESLLTFDRSNRLGCFQANSSIQDIKNHAFFSKIDWIAMREKSIPTPFLPDVEATVYATKHTSELMDLIVMDNKAYRKEVKTKASKDTLSLFKDFDYTRANQMQIESIAQISKNRGEALGKWDDPPMIAVHDDVNDDWKAAVEIAADGNSQNYSKALQRDGRELLPHAHNERHSPQMHQNTSSSDCSSSIGDQPNENNEDEIVATAAAHVNAKSKSSMCSIS